MIRIGMDVNMNDGDMDMECWSAGVLKSWRAEELAWRTFSEHGMNELGARLMDIGHWTLE